MRNVNALAWILMALGMATATPADAAWYKGNTHTHTTNSDGDSSPDAVAAWYQEHGYHFLVITDHNKLTQPESVTIPLRPDFMLIPGVEITGFHAKTQAPIHTTAQGVNYRPRWQYSRGTKTDVIQYQVDETYAAAGIPVLAHPVWLDSIMADDILSARDLHLFELWNGHIDAYWNYYESLPDNPSGEDLWDDLLTRGMRIYGVGADDQHTLSPDAGVNDSGPGTIWIVVDAGELSTNAINDAMQAGRFYTSNGVMLKAAEVKNRRYVVAVDEEATQRELSYGHLFASSRAEGPEGYTIEFVGPEGKVLQRTAGTSAAFTLNDDLAYVRCRVTLVRETSTGREAFHAWTQPVFGDFFMRKE